MNPHQRWCHNRRCRAYGRPGEGHVVIHSQKERRYQCKRCGRTFTETKDTAFYRMHKPKWLVVAVMTLLSYGCPLQAIVAAFDLDENAPSLAGKENPAPSAGGCMSTSLRQVRWRFYRCKPTRSGSRRWVGFTG